MAESVKEVTSLQKVQTFDPASIARTSDLGNAFAFTPAVPAAIGIVQLFRQIPEELLAELPDQVHNVIGSHADNCWATIQIILRFDPNKSQNAAAERQGLIDQLKNQHHEAFVRLAPTMAYAANRERDVSATEAQAQALLASAQLTSAEIESLKQQSTNIIEDVRKLAAKAGVATQANYFDEQASAHATDAGEWQTRTYWFAGGLAAFALATWIIGFWVEPKTTYQAVQWGLSKLLIFSTIAFLLFLSSRTLLANRHNEVVNRHRHNALRTFNALADAATTEQTREVVLTHASACIYAPQESGFTKPAVGQSSPSLVEILPRVMG